MKKTTTRPSADDNIWDSTQDAPEQVVTADEIRAVAEQVAASMPQQPRALNAPEYDMEGLMTDFPTAKELERFVFDETGIVLNLKGRANKLKYQVAMDVLNGVEVDPVFLGHNNPYLDKTEMVPEEPLKPTPARDASLPDHSQIQNTFWSPAVPHPDATARAMDKKCHVMFRKYNTGVISYEIQGPLEQYGEGTKIDKYGRERPEIIKWLDPRTGEQTAVRADGSLTPQGRRLRAMMQSAKFRINNSTQWDTFVDREFITINDRAASNPWDLS